MRPYSTVLLSKWRAQVWPQLVGNSKMNKDNNQEVISWKFQILSPEIRTTQISHHVGVTELKHKKLCSVGLHDLSLILWSSNFSVNPLYGRGARWNYNRLTTTSTDTGTNWIIIYYLLLRGGGREARPSPEGFRWFRHTSPSLSCVNMNGCLVVVGVNCQPRFCQPAPGSCTRSDHHQCVTVEWMNNGYSVLWLSRKALNKIIIRGAAHQCKHCLFLTVSQWERFRCWTLFSVFASKRTSVSSANHVLNTSTCEISA